MPIRLTQINVNKITVENQTFSLNALIANPNKYLPLMKLHIPARSAAQKASEDFENYLKRLFTFLHRRAEFAAVTIPGAQRAATTPVVLPDDCGSILNAMGIELVKKCPKRSSILFKHSGNKYRMNNEEMGKLIEAIKKCPKLKSKTHPKISIGVEMEFIGEYSKLSQFHTAMRALVGEDRYNAEMCYNKNKGEKWVLGTDGSVQPCGSNTRGKRGYELTSPILNLASKKDMDELRKVTEIVKDVFGGTTNKTCGTHVHMSFPVACASDELIMHFARSYKKSEKTLFDRVVPMDRRENHAHYSRSISMNYIFDRYRKLNFCNVRKNSESMHLEFRQLDGTLDFEKIQAWCKLQQLFIEITLDTWKKKSTDDDQKPVAIELEDVIATKAAGGDVTVEGLLKMSRFVA